MDGLDLCVGWGMDLWSTLHYYKRTHHVLLHVSPAPGWMPFTNHQVVATIGVPSCPPPLARLIFPKWFRPISGFSNNFSPPTTDLPHSPLNSHLRPWQSQQPVLIIVSNRCLLSATCSNLFFKTDMIAALNSTPVKTFLILHRYWCSFRVY